MEKPDYKAFVAHLRGPINPETQEHMQLQAADVIEALCRDIAALEEELKETAGMLKSSPDL